MKHEPYLLLPLTRDETQTLYHEVIAGLITTEDAAKKSNDTTLIPRLMDRIYNLNCIEEKMQPHVTLLGTGREQHPARGSRRAPAGQE
jgi:hypothetical protein